MNYTNDLKKYMCIDVCVNGKSTMKTAEVNAVPLKTFEKWITAFRKDPTCFNDTKKSKVHIIKPVVRETPYDSLSNDDLKMQLMLKDIEIARLKKAYIVKEGGTGEKVFITFSKKNTK